MPNTKNDDIVGILLDAGRRLIGGHRKPDRHCHKRGRRPEIESIDPIQDPAQGGDDHLVTIRGRRLRRVTEVQFGDATVQVRPEHRVDDALRIPVPDVRVAVPVGPDDVITFPAGVAVTVRSCRSRDSDPLTFTYNGGFPGASPFGLEETLPLPPSKQDRQPTPGAQFGASVSISDDGTRLAVGARNDNSERGATYLYRNDLGTWTFVRKIQNTTSATPADQGFSVSVSGDGTHLAIGRPKTLNEPVNEGGLVYVYANPFDDGPLTEPAVLENPVLDNHTASVGTSVSLSRDATTLAVGAPGTLGVGDRRGATHIYVRDPMHETWSLQATLIATIDPVTGDPITSPDAQQGFSVSLNADGDVVLVGAPFNTVLNPQTGFLNSGLFFARDPQTPTSWELTSAVSATTNVGAQLGRSVSLSRDGEVAILGGVGLVAIVDGGDIITKGGLRDPPFGNGVVAFNGERTVAVGIVRKPVDGIVQSAVNVYSGVGGEWPEQTATDLNLHIPDPTATQYGASLAVSASTSGGFSWSVPRTSRRTPGTSTSTVRAPSRAHP